MTESLLNILAAELVRLEPGPPLALARQIRAALDEAVPGWRASLLDGCHSRIEVTLYGPAGIGTTFVLCAKPEGGDQ